MLTELCFGEVGGSAVLVLLNSNVLQANGSIVQAAATPLSSGKVYDIYCLLSQVIFCPKDFIDFQHKAKEALRGIAKSLQSPGFVQGNDLRVYFGPTLYLFQRRRRLFDEELAGCIGDVLGLYFEKAEELLEYWADVVAALNYVSRRHNAGSRTALQRAVQLRLPDNLMQLWGSLRPLLLEIDLVSLRPFFSQAQISTLCSELIALGSPKALQVADSFASDRNQLVIVRLALDLPPSEARQALLQQLLHKRPYLLQDLSLQALLDSPLRQAAQPLFVTKLLGGTEELELKEEDQVFLATRDTIRKVIRAKQWKTLLWLVKAKGPECLGPFVLPLLEAGAPEAVLRLVTCRGELLRMAKHISRARAPVLTRAALLRQCTAHRFVCVQTGHLLGLLCMQALRLTCLWLRTRTRLGRLPLVLTRLCLEYLN